MTTIMVHSRIHLAICSKKTEIDAVLAKFGALMGNRVKVGVEELEGPLDRYVFL